MQAGYSEFSLRVDGCELMNSRVHGSKYALAELVPAVVAWYRGLRLWLCAYLGPLNHSGTVDNPAKKNSKTVCSVR
jgi:hypothetical protein